MGRLQTQIFINRQFSIKQVYPFSNQHQPYKHKIPHFQQIHIKSQQSLPPVPMHTNLLLPPINPLNPHPLNPHPLNPNQIIKSLISINIIQTKPLNPNHSKQIIQSKSFKANDSKQIIQNKSFKPNH